MRQARHPSSGKVRWCVILHDPTMVLASVWILTQSSLDLMHLGRRIAVGVTIVLYQGLSGGTSRLLFL